MRRFALAALLSLLSSAAIAGPAEGLYSNTKGAVLAVQAVQDDGFDFGLTSGAPTGARTCPEGEVACLHVEGHAALQGRFFTYIDPEDDTSRIFFALTDQGVKILSTTGPLGSGTGNRAAMLGLPGLYLPEAGQGDTAPADQGEDQTAGETLHAFRSPTGNIACLFVVEQGTEVRCDLMELNRSFTTPPADCDLDWGDSFSVAESSKRGALVCHGDTVADPEAEVLDYGSTLTYGGITCTSDKTGMTCETRSGHGFTLSRKRQQLF